MALGNMSQQKNEKKNFAPEPPQGPLSFGPPDPKSDALPFCHGNLSQIGQKFHLYITLVRRNLAQNRNFSHSEVSQIGTKTLGNIFLVIS